jgi:hypothetical protein
MTQPIDFLMQTLVFSFITGKFTARKFSGILEFKIKGTGLLFQSSSSRKYKLIGVK